MKTEPNVIEIEVGGEKNRSLFFLPLQRRIRGRLDLNRVPNPTAKMLMNEWPEPFPGQRLSLNLDTGTAQIIESLHDPEHSQAKRRIEKKGMSISDPVEEIASVDRPTWLHHMRRAVEAGLAELKRGTFPDDLGGVPQKSFIVSQSKSTNDRLADAIEKQTEVLSLLVASLRNQALKGS